MKKLAILSVTLLFAMAFRQTKAQDTKEYANTGAKKEMRVEKRNEKKTERRELRELKGNKVSTISMRNFKTDFDDVSDANWKRTPNYDIAAFTKDEHEFKAYYDADGQLVGTTSMKTFKEIPVRGQKSIKTKYQNYTVGQIIYFNNNEANRSPMILFGREIIDASNYFVELAKGDKKLVVYVDNQGNVSFFKDL